MTPGRNDPCHCGSDRKYKRCCADADAHAAAARSPLGLAVADLAEAVDARSGMHWEAELVPLNAGIVSDATARPAAMLIVNSTIVLHADMVQHPPAAPDDIAALLGDAIVANVERLRQAPSTVHVRHDAVADSLRERVASLGIEVQCERVLPDLAVASASLRASMTGTPTPPISMPHTWGAWELGEDVVRDIFGAAATFYEAKPWQQLANEEILDLEFPAGTTWFAAILGMAAEEFGLVLYESLDDFELLFAGDDAGATFSAMQGMVLSLTFEARSDLPKPMRREVTAAKWPVAGPRAYPIMWTLNTPGGGLTSAQALELAGALRAVAGYVPQLAAVDARHDASLPEEWTDERSGVVVRWLGPPGPPPLWIPPLVLTPSLPAGPAADPLRVRDLHDDTDDFATRERAVLERFERWLRESGAPDARARRDIENAGALVEALLSQQGIGLAAMTEYDLRVFLYDLYPRKFAVKRRTAMTMRGSLGRFFEYLAAHEELEYPWSAEILLDKEAYEERWDSFPGGHWWDDDVREWQADLYDDLHARVMMPPPVLADDGRPHETMGGEEHGLWLELGREWMRWRDEMILSGTTDPELVRELLLERESAWERQPRANLGGRSARSVVEEERARQGEMELPFG